MEGGVLTGKHLCILLIGNFALINAVDVKSHAIDTEGRTIAYTTAGVQQYSTNAYVTRAEAGKTLGRRRHDDPLVE